MSFDLKLDSKLFDENTVLQVFSNLAEKIGILEMSKSSDSLIVKLESLQGHNDQNLIALINMKLVEQKLKDTVYEKTKDIRTLILANAFSKTSLIDE